jgi:hypothetical protein
LTHAPQNDIASAQGFHRRFPEKASRPEGQEGHRLVR